MACPDVAPLWEEQPQSDAPESRACYACMCLFGAGRLAYPKSFPLGHLGGRRFLHGLNSAPAMLLGSCGFTAQLVHFSGIFTEQTVLPSFLTA